jgi:hypothetical protein
MLTEVVADFNEKNIWHSDIRLKGLASNSPDGLCFKAYQRMWRQALGVGARICGSVRRDKLLLQINRMTGASFARRRALRRV